MRLLLLTIFLFSNLSAESGILEIKWPKPNPKYQKPIIPYPHVLIDGIANTKLPIYIPNSYAYDKNMIVVANENFYTISFILDGAIFMVSGDKTYQKSISKSDSKAQTIMKKTSLKDVYNSLIFNKFEIILPDEIIKKAKNSIERMIKL